MNKEELQICIVGECSNWNQRNLVRENIPVDIRVKIEDSDIFIFNLEGPIINEFISPERLVENDFIRKISKFLGKLQPLVTNTEEILEVLNLTGCNVACLANNHILDGGEKSIHNTVEALKKKKFLYLGAGENIAEASKPLIIKMKDKKIGIVNYNFIGWRKWGVFVNIYGATKKKAGANYAKKYEIKKQLEKLSQKVDYTIAIFHIGRELKERLSAQDKNFLESLSADLIITHHAHIFQTIESSRIISCGDFIFNYPSHLPDGRKSNLIEIANAKIYEHELIIKEGIPYLGQS